MHRRQLMLALAAAALAPAPAFAEAPPLPPPIDVLAPLALATPEGVGTTLGQALVPGPAVISFWATWCAPCLAEGRHLARLRARYAPEALNIIGINLDRERDEGRMARFIARGDMGQYTQLRGDSAVYRAFGGEPGVIALPRCFVFAADGRPTASFGRYSGAATLRAIDRAVEGVVILGR